MARLPELDPAKFSPEQKKVHEAILAGPRGKVVGPLKVWLNNPGLAEHAQALGAYARFNSSLPPRLSELAICVTGAFWKANYEWFAHAPLAIKAGIDPAAHRGDPHRRDAEARQNPTSRRSTISRTNSFAPSAYRAPCSSVRRRNSATPA